MHKIEKKNYGFKITSSGITTLEETREWIVASEKILKDVSGKFGLFSDIRNLSPVTMEIQEKLQEGQKLYKDKGLERSAIIVNSATAALQFKKVAKKTGIYKWERYIDSSTRSNWESLGEKWLTDAIDPDNE